MSQIIPVGGSGGGYQAPSLPVDLSTWTFVNESYHTITAAEIIVAPGANTDGLAIFAASLSHDQNSTVFHASIGVDTADPGHPTSFEFILAHIRESTWNPSQQVMSALAPLWFPAGYGLYVDVDTSVELNWQFIYKLGPNPDPASFADMSAAGVSSGVGLGNVVVRANNLNGAFVYGWGVGWSGDGTGNGVVYFIDETNTYRVAANCTPEARSAHNVGVGAPIYLPPNTGMYVSGTGGSGSCGFRIVEYL